MAAEEFLGQEELGVPLAGPETELESKVLAGRFELQVGLAFRKEFSGFVEAVEAQGFVDTGLLPEVGLDCRAVVGWEGAVGKGSSLEEA